ncbi:MAG TPA: response regulator transcription factor [Microbacteriaceae bacterium]|nr:response regulator transcription factor [Microbacteriaceae bacterium]
MIRVLVVDDHELVRHGIVTLLETAPDVEVVAEAAGATEAVARARATKPDVAVLDMRLPDGNGVDLCRHIRSEREATHCIILTAYDDDQAMEAAVLAGASDYVLKDIQASGLLERIRSAAAGRSRLGVPLRRQVADTMSRRRAADPRLGALSTRERQVLALVAEGMTNREIGIRLSLAEKTVKNYVSNLLAKLGVEHRTQAAVLHLQAGRGEAHPAAEP